MKVCTRKGTECDERDYDGVCLGSLQCAPLLPDEEDIINRRAKTNTEDNRRRGINVACDGYCATYECVCI